MLVEIPGFSASEEMQLWSMEEGESMRTSNLDKSPRSEPQI